MVERKNIIFQPQEQDIPSGITVAIVGGGPAAIHLVEALRPRLGVKETIAVFEQRPRLGAAVTLLYSSLEHCKVRSLWQEW